VFYFKYFSLVIGHEILKKNTKYLPNSSDPLEFSKFAPIRVSNRA
jgi:hypothetical protein